jgi:hypothetical protein
MGIKDIWNRLFGREAEIDYSAPLPKVILQPSPMSATDRDLIEAAFKKANGHPHPTGVVGIDIAPADGAVGVSVARRKSVKRGKKSAAHGKTASKSKSRSQKKPSTRKRTRK